MNATTLYIVSTPNPSKAGTAVALIAEVDEAQGPSATGAVTFDDGGTSLGSANLVAVGAGQGTLSAGGGHTCALLKSEAVKCWGYNAYNQVGDGTTTTTRLQPTAVKSGPTNVRSLAGGAYFSCAARRDGQISCWGNDDYGQMGNGTEQSVSLVVPVTGITNAVDVAAGQQHACALLVDGRVKCWGSNDSGQLGDGTTTARPTPVYVLGINNAVAVATGVAHSCAVLTTGGVRCWGENSNGQLGDDTRTSRTRSVAVYRLSSGVAAVTAGKDFTCAVLISGGAKCWGNNGEGQLGDGTNNNRLTPVPVQNLSSGVAGLAAGSNHACAVTTSSGVVCWGYNDVGQLGNGTRQYSFSPVGVVGLSNGVVSVTAGNEFTCAHLAVGTIKCWGENGFGQYGNGTTTVSTTPVQTSGFVGQIRARATLSKTALAVGSHTISASYGGDGSHSGSSATVTQTVR